MKYNFLNKVIVFIEKTATKKTWPIFLVSFFLLVVFCNGVSLVPYPKYQLLSIDPFIKHQETILLPFIGYITKQNSAINFTGLCSFILLFAYSLFVFFSKKYHGIFTTLLISTLLFTNPLTTILLSWIGMPDGLTFLLTIPFLFLNSPIAFFILAFLGTINHITFLFAMIEIIILRLFSHEKIRIIHLISAILGGAIGLIIVQLFVAGGKTRLDFVINRSLLYWINLNLSELPLTLFSFLNIQWIVVISCFLLFFKKAKLYYSSVLLFILINYGISFFALDTTRIFCLISWGVFIHCVYYSYKLSLNLDSLEKKRQFQIILIAAIISSLVLPRFFSWEGSIHLSPFWVSIMKLIYL